MATVQEPLDREAPPAPIRPRTARVQSLPLPRPDTVVTGPSPFLPVPPVDPAHASTEDDPDHGVLFADFGAPGAALQPSAAAGDGPEPQLTEVVNRAGSMAAAFASAFTGRTVGGDVKRAPRIQALEVDTPGVGRVARQSVLLIPVERGFRSLVCGFIDVPHRYARLRGHGELDRMHRARTATAVPLDAAGYAGLVQDMAVYLRSRGYTVQADGTAAARPVARGPSVGVRVAALLGGMVLGLVLLGGTLWITGLLQPRPGAASPRGTPAAQ
ncbi:MAG: hypothetical protein HY904_02025 [Deltaproteobacteria bacterium]|nr:hypothetical protein [Deltaproteobacteria bacterium]